MAFSAARNVKVGSGDVNVETTGGIALEDIIGTFTEGLGSGEINSEGLKIYLSMEKIK